VGRDEDDERRLFEEAMRDVRRIEHEKTRVSHREKPRAEVSRRAPAGPDLSEDDAPDEVFDAGVPPKTRSALRNGGLKPEATLDLHGATGADARRQLETFVHEARGKGRRTLLVITGRGLRSGPAGPVLRERVVSALRQSSLAAVVLGFTQAPPSLGGAGAILVLLRRV